MTALINALLEHDHDRANALLDQGADVNARNDAGETPLHVVKSDAMARRLIAMGAHVNANDLGWTPLFFADDDDHATLLLDHGADPMVKDDNDEYPHEVTLSEPMKAAYEKALMRQATQSKQTKKSARRM